MVISIVQLDTSNGVRFRAVKLNSNEQLSTFQLRRYVRLLLGIGRRGTGFSSQVEDITALLARTDKHGYVDDGAHGFPCGVCDSDTDIAVGDVLVSEGRRGHVVLASGAEIGTLALAGEVAPAVGAVAVVLAGVGRALSLARAASLDVLHLDVFRRCTGINLIE